MAKKKRAQKKPAPKSKAQLPPDTKHAVDKAVRKLREHYKMGQRSLRVDGERFPYNKPDKTSPQLYQARNFARTFSEEEVKELIRLCREHKRAMPLNFSDRLATIKDAAKRKRLTAEAIGERWSTIRLNSEIRQRFGRRKRAGRRSPRPANPKEAVSKILELCLSFTRWGGQMGWQSDAECFAKLGEADVIQQLPKPVFKELGNALRAISRLQEVAEGELPGSSGSRQTRARRKK